MLTNTIIQIFTMCHCTKKYWTILMPFIIFKYNKCYCTALGTNAPSVKTEYSMTGCFFLTQSRLWLTMRRVWKPWKIIFIYFLSNSVYRPHVHTWTCRWGCTYRCERAVRWLKAPSGIVERSLPWRVLEGNEKAHDPSH